jgi:hypothetical protein
MAPDERRLTEARTWLITGAAGGNLYGAVNLSARRCRCCVHGELVTS